MRIPRDIGASDIIRALRILGYERVRQDGSHIRLQSSPAQDRHPARRRMKPVAAHHKLTVEELLKQIGL